MFILMGMNCAVGSFLSLTVYLYVVNPLSALDILNLVAVFHLYDVRG